MCDNNSSNGGYLKKILGAICGFLNNVFSCGSSLDSSGYPSTDSTGDSSSDLGGDVNCSSGQQMASFEVYNENVFMSTKADADSANMKLIASYTEGSGYSMLPPSNFEIQQVFPGYGFPEDSDATSALDTLFQSHHEAGNEWGDGQIFHACVESNAPKVYQALFQVRNGEYYMNVNNDPSHMISIGKVIKSGDDILPPTQVMVTEANSKIWLAGGTKEEEIRNLFFKSIAPSGGLFPVDVFNGQVTP